MRIRMVTVRDIEPIEALIGAGQYESALDALRELAMTEWMAQLYDGFEAEEDFCEWASAPDINGSYEQIRQWVEDLIDIAERNNYSHDAVANVVGEAYFQHVVDAIVGFDRLSSWPGASKYINRDHLLLSLVETLRDIIG